MGVVLDEYLTGWVGCYSKMSDILQLLLGKHGKCKHCLAQRVLQGVGDKDPHSDSQLNLQEKERDVCND